MNTEYEVLKLENIQLLEAVAILTEQLARTRHSNKICRVVIRSLREQLNIAHMNDELMKELCAPDVNIETDVWESEGGLPKDTVS